MNTPKAPFAFTGSAGFKLALAISVILNIFLGSIMLGQMIFGKDHHQDRSSKGDRYTLRMELRALDSALPDEARKALRQSLNAARTDLRAQIDDIHATRRYIRDLLTAPQLDSPALSAAFARLNQDLAALQRPLQSIIVDSAEKMTADQRAEMARALSAAQSHASRKASDEKKDDEKRDDPR
ncbi:MULTISPECIES: periplasmic heavy metal sensor [unclassified Iodidimonas]|jgi:uncharacterized membrane protein|uniref:periplasmic heavy metal sensor n=1 Tax=unclassified Iodidimonas TaxID=2626145 RepID=UPI002483125B|nr:MULTISPECIES: periplasmic heavy metal sensor [unclassified Iodidimonas]